MIIVLRVDAPVHKALAIKEVLAMEMEKYGDIHVLEIRDERPERMKIGG